MANKKPLRTRKKTAKRHNVFVALFAALWGALWRFVRFTFRGLRKKPVLFTGLFFFLCALLLVAYNAIFLQPQDYKNLLSPEKNVLTLEHQENSKKPKDSIAALIEQKKIMPDHQPEHHDLKPFLPAKKDLTHMPVMVPSITSEDIKRVQAALRGFGNTDIKISGVEDQATKHAVFLFEKMFSLPQTGRIDNDLLKKMKSIGLLKDEHRPALH